MTATQSLPGESLQQASVMETIHDRYVNLCYNQFAKRQQKRSKLLPTGLDWICRGRIKPFLREILVGMQNRDPFKDVLKSAWTAGTLPGVKSAAAKHGTNYWARRRDFIYHEQIVVLLGAINTAFSASDTAALNDKRRMTRRFGSAGLSHIPIISEFANGIEQVWDGHPEIWEQPLFSKPVSSWGGLGAESWSFKGHLHNQLDLPSLKRHFSELSKKGVIIVQPRMTNHPAIQALAGDGLSSVRLITVRKSGDTIDVALAVFRMPRGDAIADNFAGGGIGAPVDLASGSLGAGVVKEWGTDIPVVHHPDTREKIDGFILPFWREVMQLAVDCHREFSTMSSVGWDIALTREGPVVVEGNAGWGVDLLQMAHRFPLADTIIPQVLAHYARQLETVST